MDGPEIVSPASETSSQLDQTQGPRQRRLWTQEEDEKLRLLVSYWGDQCGRNGHWVKISSHFDNRTPKDCRKRWFHSLDPRHKRGRWTESEDRTLIEAYERLGPQWQRVAQLIPGRTDDQCAKRWSDVLDPSISMRLRDWDEEEDRKLLDLIEKYGTKWRVISKEMEGRTGLTCRNRWRKLVRMSEKAQQAADKANFASQQANGPLPPPPKELSLLEAIMPSGDAPAPSTIAFLSNRGGTDQTTGQSIHPFNHESLQSGKTYTMSIEDPASYEDGGSGTEAQQYALNELDLDKVLDAAAKNQQKIVIHQHIYTIYAPSGSGIAPRAPGPHSAMNQPSSQLLQQAQLQHAHHRQQQQQQQQQQIQPQVQPTPQPQQPISSDLQPSGPLPVGAMTPAMGGLPDEFMVMPGMLFDIDRQDQAELQLDYLAFNPS